MPNSLAREARRKIGPTALDTFFKHYFNRVKREKAAEDTPFTQLRRNDLLYDETFNIIKKFFEVAAHHTVEELQAFSQVGVSSPSWVHVVSVTVPMSCCNEAATLLIQALGGEEHTSRLVGGTKWWQVRDIAGIPGEWVTAKNSPSSSSEPSNIHDGDVDKFCCVLFSHGGGYFFGSLDQERHCAQRFARMTKGRVFSVNYRLAPQYPFPCALQDLVAAYLYMIQPPPDATHQPVKPSRIVVAGGTAGGGLTLALLQVLRDTGRPLPAGGILISPWCDLTHSFPSIHTNIATDVFPSFGLSVHKPSTLWPPPSEEMAQSWQRDRQIASEHALGDILVDAAAAATPPPVGRMENQSVSLETKSGETLKIETQVHLYTQNRLLAHPFVSPALSYLGGLPPLFIIVGDKEVLRDEILYLAHKAADPAGFLLKDRVRSLYPPLVGIEDRYGPTQVHLQVYDDAALLLPIIFPFTAPAKCCYRAMATFAKHVTGMPSEVVASAPHRLLSSPANEDLPSGAQSGLDSASDTPAAIPDSSNIRPFSWSTFSSFLKTAAQASMSGSTSERSPRQGEGNLLRSRNSQNVGDPGTSQRHASMIATTEVRFAGEPSVYYNKEGLLLWKEGMIRERVSIRGIIRPMEPTDKLDTLLVSTETIGIALEENMRLYIEGKTRFDRKYAWVSLKIERERNRNKEHARKDINGRALGKQNETPLASRDGLESSTGTQEWAWAEERPPPSSILFGRDLVESCRLGRITDQFVLQDEPDMSSNDLWAIIMNFLAAFPPRKRKCSTIGVSQGQTV